MALWLTVETEETHSTQGTWEEPDCDIRPPLLRSDVQMAKVHRLDKNGQHYGDLLREPDGDTMGSSSREVNIEL